MGRIFEKRKYKMFARYDRMAKAFTKIGREIAIAVRTGGTDPAHNPRLRMAVQNAKGVNMPKDRVEAAIHRAAAKDASGFEEVLYEGYAPHGIAVMIECATDNPNRTIANLRHIFRDGGASIGNSGSVAFLFERKGVTKVKASAIVDPDAVELELIDHGLEDFEKIDDEFVLTSSFENFGKLHRALESLKVEAISSELHYLPTVRKELPEDQAKQVLEFIESVEADEDVQAVHHNLQ
ncbi:MAG: transcriptional regulator [Ignavibacteria bacterium GWA2_55_11]|nr:MAG: transcriptional regulator [Ignavibacteria bacterium GWA2_55_11]OGU65620.1 MAG: transcriptional regulator [Ignavibacteria bacterium RIFCSPHIGHO2_02_FULL_56_12]OGU73577.1 MAG: transcriptional regulator [Ignavibacteria bacterium RIFCSPLOWO2_12_FULL_56_21]OGU74119.1 MAG: transcriptional regulator [Ignavibacteria bacterium RIFCSPLOWO2_02_FULL_55_14]